MIVSFAFRSIPKASQGFIIVPLPELTLCSCPERSEVEERARRAVGREACATTQRESTGEALDGNGGV